MKKDHYTNKKCFRFYALVLHEDELNYIYIGKTTAQRISAVYSTHICGRNAATECYFDSDNRPQLHILNEKILTTADAYKHVVAYVAIFQAAGYQVINHQATLAHAQQPKPETLAIIQSLNHESTDTLLKRTRINKPSAADRPPIAKPAEAQPPIQMNIRIKKEDKLLFDNFRKKHHLNQQEAFSLLLDQSTNKHYSDLFTKKDAKIQKLEKQNAALQQKLAKKKTPAIPAPEQHSREFLRFANRGIPYYLDTIPVPNTVTPLPRYSYRHFIKKISDGVPYEYPIGEGYSIMQLETILWSNNRSRACFLLGSTSDGKRIKLRYYPREYQLTTSFLDSPHAYVGAKWLVGYQPAKDNAMELVLAFPLCDTTNVSTDLQPGQPSPIPIKSKKLSLSEQISNASKGK